MRRRILNKYNFISLLIVPLILWSFNFIFHLLIRWILEPKVWITLISVALPLLGYFVMLKLYSRLSNRLSEMMLPEIPGIIGFLYSQPAYVVFYMTIMKMSYQGKILPIKEAMKVILILTPIVPLSTIMVSTYDGTLVAVPLTCLAMILAGYRYRRKSKAQSV